MQQRSRWLLPFGIVAVLALVGAVAVGLFMRPAAVVQSEVERARERWAARPFADYQLVFTRDIGGAICQQEIEAQGDQVARVVMNTCGQPATWTVNRLLDWVSELEHTPSRCFPGPGFCACQASPLTAVTYDPLGYPISIRYEWQMGPNWMHRDYWSSLSDKAFPGCNRQGFGGPLSVNVRLSPEP